MAGEAQLTGDGGRRPRHDAGAAPDRAARRLRRNARGLALIALEFGHTLLGVLERRRSIVQARTTALIASLAIARKFLILDPKEAEHTTLLGLVGVALPLGGVYWLDRRPGPA